MLAASEPDMKQENAHPSRVIFACLPSGVFGNGGQSWISIDLTRAREMLKRQGLEVIELTIDQLFEAELTRDDIVIYCSCDEPEMLGYLKDVFYFIRNRCQILPGYEFLLAHENKGFQELHKSSLGIGNLDGDYFYDLDRFDGKLPVVFKTIAGAGSSGVCLIRDEAVRKKIRKKYFRVSLIRKVIRLQRKFKLTTKHYEAYHYRHKGFRRHVMQEFVPGMSFDYKVLIFGDRFFVLKRFVRDGDFRASGSGKFDFEANVPDQVLNFALDISERLSAPQLSLDIAQSQQACHLIEYQALNFGPITLKQSKGHYRRGDGTWDWIAGASDLDECFSHSLEAYFRNHFSVFY